MEDVIVEKILNLYNKELSDLMIGYNINEKRVQQIIDLIAEDMCNWIYNSWQN